MSSLKFVVSSLDAIASSKDAQKNKKLGELANTALTAIKEQDKLPDPDIVFAPLQLATKTHNTQLTTSALDCIGKLISYSYFSVPGGNGSKDNEEQAGADAPPLIERAIDTICDCFEGETTAPEIQLQIVKSLLAAVLNDKIVVHGAGLLKAVRQVYNVFLLSRSTSNQQVAQGTLTQMVGTVFERVKLRLHMKESRLNLSHGSNEAVDEVEQAEHVVEEADQDQGQGADTPATELSEQAANGGKLTLKDLEHRKSFDDSTLGEGPTTVTRLKGTRAQDDNASVSNMSVQSNAQQEDNDALDDEDEVHIRDAYLVFRSFCNLSTKVLPPDQLYDVRGQPMRSKLISLHLIHTLLNNNITVFTSPLCTIRNSKSNESTTFLQAIKFYLCLSITRNGASSVDRVFEVCCEIFWLMLKYMRPSFKKEIEVILNEIYLALLSRKNGPISQKLYFVTVLNRLCADPRALVETYLNYDCDQSVDNIYQKVIEDLSKFATTPVAITSVHEQAYEELRLKTAAASEWQLKPILPPSLTVARIITQPEAEPDYPKEYAIKRLSLEALVEALRSLVNWSAAVRTDSAPLRSNLDEGTQNPSMDELRPSQDPSMLDNVSTPLASTPILEDDPDRLEKEKARKTALTNAVRQFNFKPKKGLKLLLRDGFIPKDTPEDIAKFLLTEDKLDKTQIGEFLGEGDQRNIDIMHAFVDQMAFEKTRFVAALRQFLQSFRLPGEGQKIDRFMLKFAERYVLGNPKAFANADTAYVLAYSVIMLNTDLHSSKIAKRMSKEEFIRNNRGINDNADLPDEYLLGIYDEIAGNEIVLTSERQAAAAAGNVPAQPTGIAAGLGQAFSNVGRDLQREAYVQQSEEISIRSEALFKTLFKTQRRSTKGAPKFIPATSFKHVGPMFDVSWMSIFSALSSQIQRAHNIEVNKLCLEGMKLATKIACLFDLATPREAFMSALKNATNLNNPQEMLAKNIEALKVILELGQTEGNVLRESWKDVLMCISQLDRLQLISGGVDESAIPDVSKARFMPPQRSETQDSRSSTQSKRPRQRSNTASRGFSHEIALESRSEDVIRSVDRIFTNTAHLSGDAMVYFARALTEVSWDEIKVSGSNDSPRTYSLQKIVEISYYNMNRIRFEWSNIWEVLGDHFNRVGCHNNLNIVFFALDSLRQLSMRFMEIDELAGFKFQKDFLKPFEHVLADSSEPTVKDMVLQCLIQMIHARGDNIRSGWRTMFGVFTVAARESHESIVNLAFENVNQVYKTKFGVVISQGAFTDLIVCLTEFSKNLKFQKKGLAALELLKSIIPTMLKTPECPLSQKHNPAVADGKSHQKSPDAMKRTQTNTSVEEGFWFPVLFAFHDVLMTGEELEVRSKALEYFFDTLIKYGGDFPPEFWDILWRQQLYPIFIVLRSRPEMSNALTHEELSVWLSTTMIQALRNMITLFTHYFDALEYMLDRFLELLALCICQENDTISRIGSNCLQQLILKNVTRFTEQHWTKIVGAFCELFERTTAHQLFTAANITATAAATANDDLDFASNGLPPATDTAPVESLKINGTEEAIADTDSVQDGGPKTVDGDVRAPGAPDTPLEEFKPSSNLQQQPVVVTAARRRFFNRIISRCVLQLLMIETVNELFSNDAVYTHIPSTELLRLMALLKRSFQFARKFNEDKELRARLWREGFMKQPPNLLKQESGSAATYVSILFRMFADNDPERLKSRPDVEAALVPLCRDIVTGYIALEEESQQRNIAAWRPVVVDVLKGYAEFPEDAFIRNSVEFHSMCVDLIGGDTRELSMAMKRVLRRIEEVGLAASGRRPSVTSEASQQ
ncbi:putative guanyl-nucleotide exchange factor [Emericellopsis atlantica]|uniref:Guanyl-nucleotide exchange factor n=1 Tax=Emericellopsis atlantica TaxID=2614577 RepID=A0A9P7ZMC0_9HYPO|nr:putative guanyl-nucleotide exchange factor [Emericellopsis atlantica]KAG9254316.1 putative guanyl-nucleotide exchange factor [Emericellopsis atlantica]